MNKGILKNVSRYGFQVEGSDDWNNFGRTTNDVFRQNCLKLKGKEIVWELDTQGKVTRVGTPDVKEEPKRFKRSDLPKLTKTTNSLLVKVICSNHYDKFEDRLNDFGSTHEVKATQTHIRDNEFIAIIFYQG